MTVPSWEVVVVARTMNAAGVPTFTEIDGVAHGGLTIDKRLTGVGRCDVGAQIDLISPSIAARLRDLVAAPCELVVRRTKFVDVVGAVTTVQHAGPITAYAINGRALTIYSPDLRYYLSLMSSFAGYSVNGLDQALIVKQLIDTFQAQTYANYGIDTTAVTLTGVLRQLTLAPGEAKYVDSVVNEIGLSANGFDYEIEPASRQLKIYSPRRGVDRSVSTVLDQRSIAQPQIGVSVASGIVATDLIGTSSSSNGTKVTSRTSGAALSTHGRASYVGSWSDVSEQATLDAHVARLAIDMGAQHLSLSPELLPVAGFSVDDLDVGDLVGYDYDAGLGAQAAVLRIASRQVSISSGRELLSIGVI